MSNEEAEVELPWIVHMVIDDDEGDEATGTRGWVHTHGLCHLGLPELEICDVNPLFLMWDAGILLNRIGRYMMKTGKIVKAGEVMAFGDENGQSVSFHVSVPIEGDEEHYKVLRLEVMDADIKCACCEEEEPKDFNTEDAN